MDRSSHSKERRLVSLIDLGTQMIATTETAEGDVTELVDEETLQDLDDDWDKAKRGAGAEP